MSGNITLSKKSIYRGVGIVSLLFINIIIWLRLSLNNRTSFLSKNDVESSFSRSAYQKIANDFTVSNLPLKDSFKILIAYAKLGDYQSVTKVLNSISLSSEELQSLFKIFAFYNKGDRQGLLDYVEKLSNPNSQVRSFYLQMRSEAYLKLGKREESLILANDAYNLDEFALVPMKIAGIIYAQQRDWSNAIKKLERALTLGLIADDDFWYHKGLTEFYLKRREQMLKSFDNVSDKSDHWYNANLFAGRHLFEKKEYKNALKFWENCELADSKNWIHQMWIGKLYKAQGERQKALDAQYISKDRIGVSSHPELLSDMIVPLVKVNNEEQLKVIEVLLQEGAGLNQRNHELYINALQDAGLYKKSLKVASNSINLLQDVDTINLDHIHNLNLRSIIHLLLENAGTDNETYWLKKLVNYQGSTNKERYIYLALRDYKLGDVTSALRALQEVQQDVTERDIKTIQILHYIYNNQPKQAIEVLLQYSDDPEYDIDRQWLQWKVLSLLQDGAEEYRQEAKIQLDKLNQLVDDNMTVDQAFEGRFNKRLKYMKKFYQ